MIFNKKEIKEQKRKPTKVVFPFFVLFLHQKVNNAALKIAYYLLLNFPRGFYWKVVSRVVQFIAFLLARKARPNKTNKPNSLVREHSQEEFVFLFIAMPLPGGRVC